MSLPSYSKLAGQDLESGTFPATGSSSGVTYSVQKSNFNRSQQHFLAAKVNSKAQIIELLAQDEFCPWLSAIDPSRINICVPISSTIAPAGHPNGAFAKIIHSEWDASFLQDVTRIQVTVADSPADRRRRRHIVAAIIGLPIFIFALFITLVVRNIDD